MIRAPTDEMWDRRRVLSCYIDLTDVVPELDLCDRAWPIWTYAEITPPAKIVHDEEGRRGQIVTLLVSGGHHIRRCVTPIPPVYQRARQFVGECGKRSCPALRQCRPACTAGLAPVAAQRHVGRCFVARTCETMCCFMSRTRRSTPEHAWRIILLSQKAAGTDVENQLFEKIQV
jgi:hypothetical protein